MCEDDENTMEIVDGSWSGPRQKSHGSHKGISSRRKLVWSLAKVTGKVRSHIERAVPLKVVLGELSHGETQIGTWGEV